MLAGLVLVLLVLAAGLSAETGLTGAVVLGLASVAWLAVNGGMEGYVLWSVNVDHGVSAADLSGLAGMGLAFWRGKQALTNRRDADRQTDR